MIRTRAIIKNLSYDVLVRDGIIPDIVSLISQSSTAVAVKRYPPFVYKTKEYAFLGVIMDYVIRAGLRINLQQNVELGVDPVTSIIPTLNDIEMGPLLEDLRLYESTNNVNDVVSASLKLSKLLCGPTSFTHEMLAGYVPTIVNILKEITAKWQYFGLYLNGTIRFNQEYSHGCFAGHPDVVTDLAVLDIKNTSSFSKMSKESSLQVLAYYALMKESTPALQYVGFILPMQRDIALYNVGTWDYTRYLNLLNEEGKKLASGSHVVNASGEIDINDLMKQFALLGNSNGGEITITETSLNQVLELIMATSVASIHRNIPIGTHISKGNNIATALSSFTADFPGRPCQMFLANPRTGKRSGKTEGQIASAAQVIRDNNLDYFTHTPYVINLCANAYDPVNGYWQQHILNEDLAFTVAMGGKGVIVHTGSRCHRSEEEALTIMEHMVRTALPYSTESCPLLLETPCGEKSEIVVKIEELGRFFFRFNESERLKLGLCVDTCHVFAAGYDPLLYLQHWEKYCQTPIRLVHFNDSKRECGSRVDRHAAPGTGHIGMEKMEAVAKWCFERRIPMLQE